MISRQASTFIIGLMLVAVIGCSSSDPPPSTPAATATAATSPVEKAAETTVAAGESAVAELNKVTTAAAEVGSAAIDAVDNTSVGRSFSRTDALLAALTIFVLSIFIGFEMITKVPPTLHTPLMSGSNAISGITLVGALLSTGTGRFDFAAVIGLLAVVMATINVVGGFLVTHRMLSMFKKR